MFTCNSTKLTSVPIIAYNSNVYFVRNDPFSHLWSHLSLKDRILRASSTSTLAVQAPREKSRPTKYKLWKSDQLVKAYEAVVSGELSVRRAAEEFDVPRATLHDRLTGRIHFGASSGPPKYLTDDDEDELALFLKNCAKVGYAQNRLQVISLVQQIVTKENLDVNVTHGWWESFKKGHVQCLTWMRVAFRLTLHL